VPTKIELRESLPHVTPMPLARFDRPFEHPDWIFEPKMDGFRAVAYIEGGRCRLVSRNHNAFKTFEPVEPGTRGSSEPSGHRRADIDRG
jgi:ATP-dependent DNA ligase